MWFTEAGQYRPLGIVQVMTDYADVKYYIGTGHGENEREDQEHIVEYGAKFPKEAGDKLFNL